MANKTEKVQSGMDKGKGKIIRSMAFSYVSTYLPLPSGPTINIMNLHT